LEVRDFAAKQNAGVERFVVAKKAEVADMSRVFRETGSELYMGAGGRGHD
jgi:phosphomethylpyrimidine synthase